MKLQNETALVAHMFRGEPEPDVMLATVVAKAGFRIEASGTLRSDAEGVEIYREDAEHEFGYFPTDMALSKPAVDLLVYGKAHAPGGFPTERMEVSFRLGGLERRLAVFGDRTWRTPTEATAPAPFRTMPVTFGTAYGGVADFQGREVPFPDNPHGKGFVAEKDGAVGAALPNVEAPAQLVRSWQDQPMPASFAAFPRQTRVAMQRGMKIIDLEQGQYELTPHVFTSAHPDMTAPALEPGTECVLTGMTPTGVLRFRVPEVKVAVHLQLGDRASRFPLRVDTLCLLPESARLILSARTSFRYRYIAGQRREAVLRVEV